jgi:hypothetical protein
MSDHGRLRVRGRRALAAMCVTVTCVSALAGCGRAAITTTTAVTAPPMAGAPVLAPNPPPEVPYTALQLRVALLTSVDGISRAAVQAGRYGALRGVRAARAVTPGVRVIPARCARAAGTGLGSAALAGVPATVASFRGRRAGVSEVLLAPPGDLAALALGHPVPQWCARYRAVAGGRVFTYWVREMPAPRLGIAARELNVHAVGTTSIDVWTVIYRAAGYVAAITLVGPAATRGQVEAIARMAYAKAQQQLS